MKWNWVMNWKSKKRKIFVNNCGIIQKGKVIKEGKLLNTELICLRILFEPFWFYHRMITNINGLNKSMVMRNINIRFIIVLLSCQMYIILIYILRLGKKSQFSRYIRITRYKSLYITHPLEDGIKIHLLPTCKFSNQCT